MNNAFSVCLSSNAVAIVLIAHCTQYNSKCNMKEKKYPRVKFNTTKTVVDDYYLLLTITVFSLLRYDDCVLR